MTILTWQNFLLSVVLMSIVVIMKAGRPYMPQRPVDFSALQGKFDEISKLLLRILNPRPSTFQSLVYEGQIRPRQQNTTHIQIPSCWKIELCSKKPVKSLLPIREEGTLVYQINVYTLLFILKKIPTNMVLFDIVIQVKINRYCALHKIFSDILVIFFFITAR